MEQSEELVLPSEAKVSESVCVTWCAECMCEARCIAKHTYVMVLLSEEEEPEAEDATLRNAEAEQRQAELDDDDNSNKRSGRL